MQRPRRARHVARWPSLPPRRVRAHFPSSPPAQSETATPTSQPQTTSSPSTTATPDTVAAPLLLEDTTLTPPQLTTAELALILRRRVENLHLSETAHLLYAERVSIFVDTLSALLFKLYVLQSVQVRTLRTARPRIFAGIRAVSLLQLPPPRLLIRPLLRYLPAFNWILAPFRAMSGAFLIDVVVRGIQGAVRERVTPHQARSFAEDLASLRDHVRDGLETSRASVRDFISERTAELDKLRHDVENKLRNDFELKLPPAIRPETPGVSGVAFRTPVKGRGFRTPVGPRAFRGMSSPRKGLVGISEEEEVGEVGSPGLALLPRSIARSVETPRAESSPPEGIID